MDSIIGTSLVAYG